MCTRCIRFIPCLAVLGAILLGCTQGSPGATTKPSGAFFSIPTSLTGPNGSSGLHARTLTSDGWVTASVERYYGMVRDQVRFGAAVAQSLKSLLRDLEQVKIGDAYLLDSETDITHTSGDGRKFRWSTETAGSFFLEIWAADSSKSLELRFTRTGTRYEGTAVASPASLGWPDPAPPIEKPLWVKAEFDTDSDGLGTARLAISVQAFRYHADLDPGLENGSIVLTKDSTGLVRLGSVIRGEGSRHFLWNGYLRDTSNEEVLNTGVTAETRYYVAAGIANTTNQASVYLGIPLDPIGTTVFTDNGIGTLVGQLFADRLNNDYDFDGSGETVPDQGHEIIALLNASNGAAPDLDTVTYSNNSTEEIFATLQAVQTNLGEPGNDYVDYLIGMMSVTNPAYFTESTYQGYGSTVPSGWPTLTEPDARALLPTQDSVDAMDIAFESDLPPDF